MKNDFFYEIKPGPGSCWVEAHLALNHDELLVNLIRSIPGVEWVSHGRIYELNIGYGKMFNMTDIGKQIADKIEEWIDVNYPEVSTSNQVSKYWPIIPLVVLPAILFGLLGKVNRMNKNL